jgi:hypothetical protein
MSDIPIMMATVVKVHVTIVDGLEDRAHGTHNIWHVIIVVRFIQDAVGLLLGGHHTGSTEWSRMMQGLPDLIIQKVCVGMNAVLSD